MNKRLTGRLLLAILVVFFIFFRLGEPAVFEYDEARNGISAIEMLTHGHWRGLWFANAPDTWANKPPLFIWALAGSFSVFGLNEFALRLPSALAALGTFFFIFLLARRYYGETFAILVCLLLLSVKGLVGNHTGRTGDYDAFLIFFLISHTYFFLRYVEGEGERNISLASLLLAGAFLTKGPAMAVFLPGQALFLWLTGKWRIFNGKVLGRQIALFVALPLIWLLWINDDGAPVRLFSYDLVDRFSDTGFEAPESPSRFTFLFVVLDAYFNLWNYVLYLLLALSALFFRKIKWKEHPLLVYGLAIWVTMGVGLSLAATTHRWYFSPALPFVAITLVFLVREWARSKWVWVAFGALLAFTLFRRAYEISFPEKEVPALVRQCEPALREADQVWYVGGFPSQSTLLYFYFFHPGLRFAESMDDLPEKSPGDAVIVLRYLADQAWLEQNGWEVCGVDDAFLILKAR